MRGRRRRRHATGARRGRSSTPAPPARCCERVDRLRVVLDRLGVSGLCRRRPSHADQEAGREHERDAGEQAADRRRVQRRAPARRAATARAATITCTIAPAPTPNRNAARLELNADAPIHAPRTAGAPAIRPSSASRPSDRPLVRDRRDDRQALGRVVQREADHEERAERERADRVRGADRDALAEVVQADPDRDEHAPAMPPRRLRLRGAALQPRRHAGQQQVGHEARRRTRAPRRRTPASPRRRARGPRASRRSRGTRAARS